MPAKYAILPWQICHNSWGDESPADEEVGVLSERASSRQWPVFPASNATSSAKQAKISQCADIGCENERKARKLEAELTRLQERYTPASQSDTLLHPDPECREDASKEKSSKRRRNPGKVELHFKWTGLMDQNVFCRPCPVGNGQLVVVNKSDNRSSSLKQHEKTASHHRFAKIHGDSKFFLETQVKVSRCTGTPAAREQRRKAYVFTLVLSSLNQYGLINGLKNWITNMMDYLPTEDIGVRSYAQTSNHSLWLMVDAMDYVLRQEVKIVLREAEFLAFTIDSSTDNSTTDYMDVKVRFWKDGKVMYLFLALVVMGANTKASDQATTMLGVIKDFMDM
ncbi:hypothetical protein PSENEW3_00000954 [Picochlorum sp. SENEW3]|nr:hypothetical protein PSENEW3_00000954 [Picochlorum sp. SENEW3]